MAQISTRIPEPLRRRISDRARRTGQKPSEVIREVLEHGLNELDPQPHGLELLASIKAHGGPTDLALNHDEHLYGDKA